MEVHPPPECIAEGARYELSRNRMRMVAPEENRAEHRAGKRCEQSETKIRLDAGKEIRKIQDEHFLIR